MITCGKCKGKVFLDLTFTENRNYEAFCLTCGNRWFIGRGHHLFDVFKRYVASVEGM